MTHRESSRSWTAEFRPRPANGPTMPQSARHLCLRVGFAKPWSMVLGHPAMSAACFAVGASVSSNQTKMGAASLPRKSPSHNRPLSSGPILLQATPRFARPVRMSSAMVSGAGGPGSVHGGHAHGQSTSGHVSVAEGQSAANWSKIWSIVRAVQSYCGEIDHHGRTTYGAANRQQSGPQSLSRTLHRTCQNKNKERIQSKNFFGSHPQGLRMVAQMAPINAAHNRMRKAQPDVVYHPSLHPKNGRDQPTSCLFLLTRRVAAISLEDATIPATGKYLRCQDRKIRA